VDQQTLTTTILSDGITAPEPRSALQPSTVPGFGALEPLASLTEFHPFYRPRPRVTSL
jgi:hypothetical protein